VIRKEVQNQEIQSFSQGIAKGQTLMNSQHTVLSNTLGVNTWK